ncbi:hypothetical protein [Mumia zhuanghuii]|uniref:Uncharacterized protein n=1 Tax=Mumia zhuanghuii TaxID=2585211 RepID=A0A5C4LTQ0_9ACTN|nr:hypothetical protein [Mumia zhuanghuii]TNC22038.1 hypothetical protein FHE65_36195 [Mumia zhuanghuii]TNC22185.1 hypothetical protein FHE65_35900 [Mumia zhuanghuii]
MRSEPMMLRRQIEAAAPQTRHDDHCRHCYRPRVRPPTGGAPHPVWRRKRPDKQELRPEQTDKCRYSVVLSRDRLLASCC